jgi:hypothetical protein
MCFVTLTWIEHVEHFCSLLFPLFLQALPRESLAPSIIIVSYILDGRGCMSDGVFTVYSNT